MNLILLPGFSTHNINLVESYTNYYKDKGFEVDALEWPHWDIGNNSDFIIDEQVKKVIGIIEKKEDKVNIISKSIGTIVAGVLLGQLDAEKLQKIVMMGLPLRKNKNRNLQVYTSLKKLQSNDILIIQNKNDKIARYDEVAAFIHKEINSAINVISNSRNDHSYPIKETKSDIDKFLGLVD